MYSTGHVLTLSVQTASLSGQQLHNISIIYQLNVRLELQLKKYGSEAACVRV